MPSQYAIRASLAKNFFLRMEVGRAIKDRQDETTILFIVTEEQKQKWEHLLLDFEAKHGNPPRLVFEEVVANERVSARIDNHHGHVYPHGFPSWVTTGGPGRLDSKGIIVRYQKTARIESLGFDMNPRCEGCIRNGFQCIAIGPFKGISIKCARCQYGGRVCSLNLTASKKRREKQDRLITEMVREAADAVGMQAGQNDTALWDTFVGA